MYISRHVQALEAYTPGEQPQCTSIVKLNTNENPYPPSPKVAEALRNFDPARLRLYPDPVCKGVRAQLAALHECCTDQIFVGNGSDEILALCTRAFVENSGAIGFFHPSYSLYPVLSDIRGVAQTPVQLNHDFTWRMPDSHRSSLFFLTNPNAPTSMIFEHGVVADFCRVFDGVVLIDEAYVDFADQDCLDLALQPDNRNTMVMRTLSKSFSLAGLRFGYVVGPVELVQALYKIKDSYNMDMLAQLVGGAALADIPHMRRNTETIRATRGRLTAALRGRGWHVCDSQTNFVFARPPCENAQAIFDRLRKDNIFVRYFPGPLTGERVRITIGTDTQIDQLLAHPSMNGG